MSMWIATALVSVAGAAALTSHVLDQVPKLSAKLVRALQSLHGVRKELRAFRSVDTGDESEHPGTQDHPPG